MRRVGQKVRRYGIITFLTIVTYTLLFRDPDQRESSQKTERKQQISIDQSDNKNINNNNNKNQEQIDSPAFQVIADNDFDNSIIPEAQIEIIDSNKNPKILPIGQIEHNLINKIDENSKHSNQNNGMFSSNPQFLDYPIYLGFDKTSPLGNYEPKEPLIKPSGPGEYGKELILPDDAETKQKVQSTISEYGFNIFASEKISMDRMPEDLRKDECKHFDYPSPDQLSYLTRPEVRASVAVVLVFHNEAFSTLMRTVHSVFNQSPPEILKEIVLIDDGSNKNDLKEKLDNYVKMDRWQGKVKLFRNLDRHGLIRARCDGARKATADILVYLDAHCEAGPNWLLPLILPILQDRKACTCPLVDVIDGNKYTFTPQAGGDADGFARGAWDWDLLWKRIPLTHREKEHRKYVVEPYRSPAMAGGLFAIDREWFFEIGLYDEELEIWGGENFEISYKLWMCGGSLLFVPCSRVGHIYRLPGWRGNPPQKSVHANFAMRNYRRVIDVWWDDYAKYFYERRPEARNVDPGDLTKMRALRERLQCKDFNWFMKEIAYDIPLRFPLVVPDNGAQGLLRNKQISADTGEHYCIDMRAGGQGNDIKMSPCQSGSRLEVMLTWHEDIRSGDNKNEINEKKMCLDCVGSGRPVTLWECHGQGGNQLWKMDYLKGIVRHALSGGCLTADISNKKVTVKQCDDNDESQKWTWDDINVKQIDKFNSDPRAAVLVKEIDAI